MTIQRFCTGIAVATLASLPATEAHAGDCPPGAFCEETEIAPPVDQEKAGPVTVDEVEVEGPQQKPVTVTLPPPAPGSDPDQPRVFEYHPDPDGGPGQIIVYEDGAAPPRSISPPEAPPPREEDEERVERHRKWGINLRVDGVLLPRYNDNVSADAGMAGLGLSLRYRPTPMFALDFSTDFIGGVDTQGLERQEIPLGLNAMLYVNPQSIAQFYLMAGINYSFARVQSDGVRDNLRDGTADDYNYFGGMGGMGLEFRVAPLVGINIDGLAFIRTRVDDDEEGRFNEYVDPETGDVSNTSAAGMMRAGVTFWW